MPMAKEYGVARKKRKKKGAGKKKARPFNENPLEKRFQKRQGAKSH